MRGAQVASGGRVALQMVAVARDILIQNHQLWIKRFGKQYTKPGDEEKTGGWKARSSWIVELNEIRNDVSHSRGINEEAFAFLVELRSWLLQGEIDNEL